MTRDPIEAAEQVLRVAQLLRRRNAIDAQITEIIGRPMLTGHLGEWLAWKIFDVQLEDSAATAAIDGRFRSGPLARKSVNVKMYGKREGLLDLVDSALVDYYLVFTGPVAAAASSRGLTRPVCIHGVYLFDAQQLHTTLREQGRKIGIASSMRKSLWDAAEIFPEARNPALPVDDEQRRLLRLLAC
jgi:hypothetical protein